MPNVSVVIPNYNHESFLKQRIESIMAQTYQDFEIILLDDCSSDNSRQIIEQYRDHPKVSSIIYNEKNSGSPFAQWKKGLDLVNGDWTWIAESDDYCEPDFLQTLLNLIYQHENVGLAMCHSHKVNNGQTEDLHEYFKLPFYNGVNEVRERLCHFNIITNVSACLLNTKMAVTAAKDLGKFKYCGDWIFYTRLLQHSNLVYSSKKMNYYRWHPGNISSVASKNTSYIVEGINVLTDIDFNVVNFSVKRFLSLGKGWLNKVKYIKLKDSFTPMCIIALTTLRFTAAKIAPAFTEEDDQAFTLKTYNDNLFE